MCLFKKKEKIPTVLVGLVQSLGVIIYCSIISVLVYFLETFNVNPPEYLGPLFVLLLLVFSAALMGLVVFGYPVYLAFEKKIKRSLQVILWTLLFLIVFGVLFLIGIVVL